MQVNAQANQFIHYLDRLSALLNRLERHAGEEILMERLAPDMFPLHLQAQVAINFCLRACLPPVGQTPVLLEPEAVSFAALQQMLARVREQLQTLPAADLRAIDRRCRDQAGQIEVDLPASDYVAHYALPNFFFHLCMVYAIARKAGVPLSKGDFDGLHQYAPGFAF